MQTRARVKVRVRASVPAPRVWLFSTATAQSATAKLNEFNGEKQTCLQGQKLVNVPENKKGVVQKDQHKMSLNMNNVATLGTPCTNDNSCKLTHGHKVKINIFITIIFLKN